MLSLPALRALRAHEPDAKLSVLSRPSVSEFYEACQEVDETIPYEPSDGLAAFTNTVRRLRERELDLAVLFPNAFRCALMMYLARIPERWGYATDGRTLLLTRRVPPAPRPFGRHQIHFYLDCLRGLGVDPGTPSIELAPTPDMVSRARELLIAHGWSVERPLVGVHPGSTNSRAKRWLPERFADVGRRFVDSHRAQVVLFGGADEASVTASVSASLDGADVVDLSAKTTLAELMGALSHLGLFVTNDSGPMHLAASLSVPTLAVFGPTDERETGPFSSKARIVREPVDCSPCLLRDCPIDHRCMTRLESTHVYDRASDLLGELAQRETLAGSGEARN